jgi:hypothetical protein
VLRQWGHATAHNFRLIHHYSRLNAKALADNMKRFLFFGIVVLLTSNAALAQRQEFFVNPQLTDPQIDLALAPLSFKKKA